VSEYQYYEFLALDRPLTDKQRAELRKLSSRAEITATRFVNEYNYGDFRGSPEKLMERHFDAFLYLANWGTRRLMFRLPRALLDAEVARQYCHTDAASVIETSNHVIVSLYLDRDPDNYWVEADDRLAPMVQARAPTWPPATYGCCTSAGCWEPSGPTKTKKTPWTTPSRQCRRVSGTSARRCGPSPISWRSTRT
jgi:hypothetical protein